LKLVGKKNLTTYRLSTCRPSW